MTTPTPEQIAGLSRLEDREIMRQLRPSAETLARIRTQEEATAIGWSRVKDMPFGTPAHLTKDIRP